MTSMIVNVLWAHLRQLIPMSRNMAQRNDGYIEMN